MIGRGMRSLAYLFPGQGSQYVGMGRDCYERYETVRSTFDEADEILGFRLSRIIFEGPNEDLVKTKNTQPAILTYSISIMRVMHEVGIEPVIVAGHSLGEYSALVCAGSLSFQDALATVWLRGELMYEAGLKVPGTMAAILGMPASEVQEVCCEASRCGSVEPANYNSPIQTVISGDMEGVREAIRIARERGARRAIRLDVSGAFHSSLMGEALAGLESHLDSLDMSNSRVPVVTNVDAACHRDADELRKCLKEQLMKPVLWEDSIRTIVATGHVDFLEVGPGKVLSRLLRKIDPTLTGSSVDGVEGIESFIRSLEGEDGE